MGMIAGVFSICVSPASFRRFHCWAGHDRPAKPQGAVDAGLPLLSGVHFFVSRFSMQRGLLPTPVSAHGGVPIPKGGLPHLFNRIAPLSRPGALCCIVAGVAVGKGGETAGRSLQARISIVKITQR
jgi:hypothetical protein